MCLICCLYLNKNNVRQQRIKPNKNDFCGWASMRLPYVVTAWAETHSRATYLITGPRIIHFKQHLSFLLLPLFLVLFSGEWDKQANTRGDHKPLSWTLACLLCMLTKITIYQVCVLFCLAAYGWFSLCITRCGSLHQVQLHFKVLMHERLPAGICEAATHLTKEPKDRELLAECSES